MLSYAMPRYTLPRDVILCYVMLCSIVPCYLICYAVLCNERHVRVVLYSVQFGFKTRYRKILFQLLGKRPPHL